MPSIPCNVHPHVPGDAFCGHVSHGIMKWCPEKELHTQYSEKPLHGGSTVGVHHNGVLNSLLSSRVSTVGVFPLDKVSEDHVMGGTTYTLTFFVEYINRRIASDARD